MAESNDEPPQCPCGFWGSAQTSGLCSVCYKRQQQQSKEHDPKLFVSATSSPASVSAVATSVGSSCQTAATVSSALSRDRQIAVPEVTVTTAISASVISKNDVSLASNIAVCQEAAMETESSAVASDSARDDSPSRPIQKNRKRCFSCKARLELAFVEIGRCKCGYTYCELHRLPEQHACTYDHKESGRQEAREKMVSPKKHVGTSLRRLDSDS